MRCVRGVIQGVVSLWDEERKVDPKVKSVAREHEVEHPHASPAYLAVPI